MPAVEHAVLIQNGELKMSLIPQPTAGAPRSARRRITPNLEAPAGVRVKQPIDTAAWIWSASLRGGTNRIGAEGE